MFDKLKKLGEKAKEVASNTAVLVWSLAALGLTFSALADQANYSISTFKNGQKLGTRQVSSEELIVAALALTSAFQERRPEYSLLLDVAKGMPAMARCFNLHASRVTLASVQSGKLDTSANAEYFLKDSVATIEAVNKETNVTCAVR